MAGRYAILNRTKGAEPPREMSYLTSRTLQYGVTRVQESEAGKSTCSVHKAGKIGFFCDCVVLRGPRAPLTGFKPAIQWLPVPPCQGGTFVSGRHQSDRAMRPLPLVLIAR